MTKKRKALRRAAIIEASSWLAAKQPKPDPHGNRAERRQAKRQRPKAPND